MAKTLRLVKLVTVRDEMQIAHLLMGLSAARTSGAVTRTR